MGVGAGLYMYDVVVKKFTFAISSPDQNMIKLEMWANAQRDGRPAEYTVFSGLQVAPEYKPHPLFLYKIWEKFIDKSYLSVSRTLFCYFLAHRNVLGCIHMMRRSARRDRRGPEKSTCGLNSMGESLR